MIDEVGAFIVGPHLLERGASGGPLDGTTFAAKDVFDVAGLPTGAGNPTRRAEVAPAQSHAWVVKTLLAAGADLIGTTLTDELAFSLSGTNVHDGTPTHPVDPTRVPGGSSAGSTVAVAHGLVDIGVGTDTGGSIRVPASYCGVVGLRPSIDRLPVEGLVPLAQSFDTVGLLTRDAAQMATAWKALETALPDDGSISVNDVLIADDQGTLIHTDHGPQFTSWTLSQNVRASGLVQSIGTVGDAYDNAVVESFWGSMQIELLNRKKWKTRIELFYNRRRRHSSLGNISPVEFERRQRNLTAA